ncbi:hypothetical protein RRG08_035197 [Elysia crispata]|uniref:Uncharacterized protein n=1 Tax=Elysia crispata TaxID=231223 RepID=A0AAE1E403_9GAST|nr:hypothetical protein RRG08_035197 [Elysia crispata]
MDKLRKLQAEKEQREAEAKLQAEKEEREAKERLKMEEMRTQLELAKIQAQASQQNEHNLTKARRFSPGNKVLVLLPTEAKKLLVQWKGPYDIIDSMGLND